MQLISLSLNLCLCIDLVQTLQSPFEVASRRMVYYQLVCFIVSGLLVLVIQNIQTEVYFYSDSIDLNNEQQLTSSLIIALSLSAYIVVALYSMIFSLRRLNRPGVSIEVRQLFQRKHSYYVLLFISIWTIQLSASYYQFFNPDIDEGNASQIVIEYMSGIAMFSTGILLALVRLYEPFFLFLMKKFVWMCFGQTMTQNAEGIKTQTLSTFLASSLNVELVHIILKGIKKFSNIRLQDDYDYEELDAAEARELIERDEKESYQVTRICRLNRIKIKNPEKWDKAKYDDFVENEFILSDADLSKNEKKQRSNAGCNLPVRNQPQQVWNLQQET